MQTTSPTAELDRNFPLITVVIPTFDRPDLLRRRALSSALRQTYPKVEIVVVLDGDDGVTRTALEPLDPRVRVVMLETRSGVSAARNAGVRAARGEWVALLDDDDEWGADKLAAQLRAARSSTAAVPVVVSGYIGRTPAGDRLHPPRPLGSGELIGDYLMVRRRLNDEECVLMASLIFAPRHLFVEVPFKEGLRSQEDWDWLLNVEQYPGVGFAQVPSDLTSTLAVYYFGENRPSGSRHLLWEESLDWAQAHRRGGRLSERAFAGFLLFQLAPRASAAGDRRGLGVLGRALLSSRPTGLEVFRFLKHAVISARLRRMLRRAVDRLRPGTRLGV